MPPPRRILFAMAPGGVATLRADRLLDGRHRHRVSQALISGAFSLTNQAMQLGFLPPVTVVHTSGEEEG